MCSALAAALRPGAFFTPLVAHPASLTPTHPALRPPPAPLQLLQPASPLAWAPGGAANVLRVDDFRIDYHADGSVKQFFTDVEGGLLARRARARTRPAHPCVPAPQPHHPPTDLQTHPPPHTHTCSAGRGRQAPGHQDHVCQPAAALWRRHRLPNRLVHHRADAARHRPRHRGAGRRQRRGVHAARGRAQGR